MSEVLTLGDLLARTGGSVKTGPFGTVLKAHEYSTHGVPVISVGEVGHGELRIHLRTPRVSPDVVCRLPEYVLRAGDVVFGRKGSVDRSALVKAEEDGYFLGSDGIRVRLGDGVCPRFLALQFRTKRAQDWLLQHASGSTMASLNQSILERLPVILPPRHVQDAIAEVLGALDDKIASNHRTSLIATELCGQAFRRMVRHAPEATSVGRIMTLEYGKALPATTRRPGQILVYGSGGVVGQHDHPLVDRVGVVVGRKGTAGSVHWAPGPHFPIDTTYFVRPSPGVPLTYCYFALQSLGLDQMNSDSAVPGLNRNEAYACPVLLPPPDDLREFDFVAGSVLDLVAQFGVENRKLAELRDTLLPELMSGRLRVRDAELVVEGAV